MFEFARIISTGEKWTDNVYFNEKHIGTMGFDKEGLWIKSKIQFSLQELNLLIAQIALSNLALLSEKLEIIHIS